MAGGRWLPRGKRGRRFWGKMAMKSLVEKAKRRKDVGHNPDAPHRLKNVTSASPACAHLPLPVIDPSPHSSSSSPSTSTPSARGSSPSVTVTRTYL